MHQSGVRTTTTTTIASKIIIIIGRSQCTSSERKGGRVRIQLGTVVRERFW